MINYFVINKFHRNIEIIENNENDKFIHLWLNTTRKNISMKEKDRFVFLDKNDREYFFSSYGYINKCYNGYLRNNNYRNGYDIFLTQENEIEINNSLNDFVYSLNKINDFEYPYRHFRNPYSHLTRQDYETIITGNIYYSRTFVGKVLKALPKEHLDNFLRYYYDKKSYSFSYIINYQEVFELLKEYLDKFIFVPGHYLNESFYILENIIGNNNLINELKFNFNEEGSDYIYLKAKDLRSFFNYLEENNIFLSLKNDIKENYFSERNFNNSFKDKTLPI